MHSDDNNSVYSFAMRSSAKAPNTPTRTPRAAESPVPSTGQRQGLQKFFGSFNLNNIASVFTPADEFDRKVIYSSVLSIHKVKAFLFYLKYLCIVPG